MCTCTCNKCEDKESLECAGKPYRTCIKLSCPFHALAYEIECDERAAHVSKILHPVLKRGHSNASHNVLMSKHIFLERLHYQLSTNLGLLQANLTYRQKPFGTSYHWIPELYRCMQLPVFEGVEEAHNIKRKRALDKAKTSEAKKRRVQWKVDRVKDAERRKERTKKHGCRNFRVRIH